MLRIVRFGAFPGKFPLNASFRRADGEGSVRWLEGLDHAKEHEASLQRCKFASIGRETNVAICACSEQNAEIIPHSI